MRHAFTQSRTKDFFTAKELTMQLGAPQRQWGEAILKELIDNALDACEGAGILPDIDFTIDADGITVTDNGPGLPHHVVDGVLDFGVRISTNSAYVSPTRGQLGNALKCVVAAPYVLNGNKGRVEIETLGKKHIIDISWDHIQQEPMISHEVVDSEIASGTKWRISSPELATLLGFDETGKMYRAKNLVWAFQSLNPHARITTNQGRTYRWSDSLKKWTTGMPTSAHWYRHDRFRNLVTHFVREQGGTTIRDFAANFRGLSRTDIRRELLERTGMTGKTMTDLVVDGQPDIDRIDALLDAMKVLSPEVDPKHLGAVGKDAVFNWMNNFGIVEDSFKHKALRFQTTDGIPYAIELAFAVFENEELELDITCGVNYTPMLNVPVRELYDLLSDCRVDYGDQCLVWVHIITPAPVFTDAGKTNLYLPEGCGLEDAVKSVSAFWTKAKRNADKDNRLAAAAVRKALDAERKKPMSQKEAAYSVMEKAYMKASSNNTKWANARQIMYAARGDILRLAEIETLQDEYFTQILLPDFIEDNPELTTDWMVAYDDRGNLIEPHTGKSVPLGTVNVRSYIQSWADAQALTGRPNVSSDLAVTSGPSGRYKFALFIEKEGFHHLLKDERFAERYDLAIMSSKGMSNTSTRRLVESLTEQGVTILVAHDFDRSGIDILAKLTGDTRRYSYVTTPKVIDIGLRLRDALEMGLESEPTVMTSGKSPAVLLREQGVTEEEVEFLVSGGRPKYWTGQRIELNAMTSDQFMGWLERKLEENGVSKVIPDQEMLDAAFKRAAFIEQVNNVIKTIFPSELYAPDDLKERVAKIMAISPEIPWEDAVQIIYDMQKAA